MRKQKKVKPELLAGAFHQHKRNKATRKTQHKPTQTQQTQKEKPVKNSQKW